jgi:hypothetical protein
MSSTTLSRNQREGIYRGHFMGKHARAGARFSAWRGLGVQHIGKNAFCFKITKRLDTNFLRQL